MTQVNEKDIRLDRAYKLSALLAGLSLALAATCVFLMGRVQDPADLVEIAKNDPEIKQLAIAALTAGTTEGSADSFPDPEVGRVLLPNIEEYVVAGTPYSSNEYGVRERSYAMPKPDGMLRVVLLGDSMMFGPRITLEQRCAVFLENHLRERSGFEGEIECIQIGMGSWNLVAECEYMRRQLSILRPDVVVHVTVGNDLDDAAGVRGFGGWSNFTPRYRQRADSILKFRHPFKLGSKFRNWLPHGLDYESRERFRDASEHILQLRDAVELRGARYMLLVRWTEERFQLASKLLTSGLQEEQVSFIAQDFHGDPRFVLGPRDPHWNEAGNERLAQLLYGLFRRWDYLPALELPEWDLASQAVEELHDRGMQEASREPDLSARIDKIPIASEIDFTNLTDSTAAQVHGGIDANRLVGAYASVILDAEGCSSVSVTGRFLDRNEIAGATLRVYVEEAAVATVQVEPGEPFEVRAPIPDEVAGRPYVSVRFECDDYAYVGPLVRDCRSFEIVRLAVE